MAGDATKDLTDDDIDVLLSVLRRSGMSHEVDAALAITQLFAALAAARAALGLPDGADVAEGVKALRAEVVGGWVIAADRKPPTLAPVEVEQVSRTSGAFYDERDREWYDEHGGPIETSDFRVVRWRPLPPPPPPPAVEVGADDDGEVEPPQPPPLRTPATLARVPASDGSEVGDGVGAEKGVSGAE